MKGIILELLDVLGAQKESQILDFGCGEAQLVEYINQNGLHCYGTDIDKEITLEAQARFACHGLEPNLLRTIAVQRDGYIIEGEAFRLPFDDNSFDIIISFQVFEHIDNLEAVVKELHRIMKPGAQLYLEFPSSYALIEPHLNIPLVQFLGFNKIREYYIYFFAKLRNLDIPKEYAIYQNRYLYNSCFYRSHKNFDQYFTTADFEKKDFAFTRRSLRFEKDRVFGLKELFLYKRRKYNGETSLVSLSFLMQIYLICHSLLYKFLFNRCLLFVKK